jgi:hypothetical protein
VEINKSINHFTIFALLVFRYDVSFSNISKNSSHHLQASSIIGTGTNTVFGGCAVLNMDLLKKSKDLTGFRYGRLIVISTSHRDKKGMLHWMCKCDCGVIKSVLGMSLLDGNTQSCGCLFIERAIESRFTHRLSKTVEYKTWQNMITRCTNPNSNVYKNYGLKGIKVCDRWLHSFENFIADMGNKPTTKHSIDRINSKGNYEPSNCRWATRKEQDGNKTNSFLIEYNGQVRCLRDWSEYLNIKYVTLMARIKVYKWSLDKAFSEPVGQSKNKLINNIS